MTIETKIPGIKSSHTMITPTCRLKGNDVALDEAIELLKAAYYKYVDSPNLEDATFHVVLTNEFPDE